MHTEDVHNTRAAEIVVPNYLNTFNLKEGKTKSCLKVLKKVG